MTWRFDVFFDLQLNKRLSEQSISRWFETPSRPLWRHCNGRFNMESVCPVLTDSESVPAGSFASARPFLRFVISQIPHSSCPIFHNAPFRTEMCIFLSAWPSRMLSVLTEECHVGYTMDWSFKDDFKDKIGIDIIIFIMATFLLGVWLDFFSRKL